MNDSRFVEKNEAQKEYKRGRNNAMKMGATVYAGVVLVGTVLFISFVLTAFPADAYFTRGIMTVGGFLVAGSLLAFPYALHNWATRDKHRDAAVGLYFGEMLFFGANTIVSFTALLSSQNGYVMPEWMLLYEPFTILSIVYVIVAWGIMFWLDPEAKKKVEQIDTWQSFDDEVHKMIRQYPKSKEGMEEIAKQAKLRVAKMVVFDDGEPKPFAGIANAAETKQEELPNA